MVEIAAGSASNLPMLGPVHIENFKSIRDLSFEARRVNLFVGEPNTGKSNIIEALSFFAPWTAASFKESFRFKTTADLFFDQKVAKQLRVELGPHRVTLQFKDGQFQGQFRRGEVVGSTFLMNHQGISRGGGIQAPVSCYFFKPLSSFPNQKPGVLNPPFGDNLVAVLYSNEELKQRIGAIVRSKGFRLQLKPTDNELLISKDVGEELYSYPWTSVSETLRRVAFLMAVLETNKNATLLLDEPESNTFPFYTKYIAERIALDETNQFFITTHNPYLLSSVVEKTPAKDVAVFVASMEKFETKVRQVPEKNLPELLELDSDAFFNLDRLVEG
jgi:hypothetical protein